MFGFTKAEREVYNSTFIRKVIINIQFPLIDSLENHLDNIKSLFSIEFPRVVFGKNKGFQISFGNNKINPNVNNIDENISLKSEDGQTELLINKDNIKFSIEGKSYTSYENNIQQILTKIIELFQLVNVNKILNCNLRKINLIEFGYDDGDFPNGILDTLLKKSVVYNDDAFPDMGKISQNIHTVQFKDGEYVLNLKYGMNTLPYEGENLGQLIVDYNIQSNALINANSIYDEIKLLNDELFNVFTWIFNDNSKGILKNEIDK